MNISEILDEKVIRVDLECKDKDEAINKMIELASHSGLMIDKEKVRQCVFQRRASVNRRGKRICHSSWKD